MAQFGTGPAQIVWSEVIQLHPFGTFANDLPDEVLGDAFSPRRSMSADSPEDPVLANLGRDHPTIDRLFDPHGHGHRPHMSTFANQIDDSPTSLSVLHIFHLQSRKLGAS
jgi:hypothetical protein